MAYTKTNWANGGSPAIDANNLNHIEQGIYDNEQKINSIFFESGTSGDWSYRKYSDGTFEAWAAIAYNEAVQTAWGSLYISESPIQVDLPSFANPSGWSVISSANGGELIRIVAKSGTATPPYFTFTPVLATSRTAANRTLSVYIKGTWS